MPEMWKQEMVGEESMSTLSDVYGTYAREEDGTPILHVSMRLAFKNDEDREEAEGLLREMCGKLKLKKEF